MSPNLDAVTAALVRAALLEDVGTGDVTTTATVDAQAQARARITQKAPGVIYGLEVAEAVFAELDPDARFERLVAEGEWREQGGPVLAISGSARALLTGERTALNFLTHLSGVATMSARAAREVQGTRARVLDTRKTIPGLRALEKAAVAAGGASNHRVGLFDAILIKENHISAAGGIAQAVERAAWPRRSWRARWRWRCATRGRSTRRSRRARRVCCWTTWTRLSCVRRSPRWRAGRSSRRVAA